MRDNMNYQEYDWFFNKANAPKAGTGDGVVDPWALGSLGTCVGDMCCPTTEEGTNDGGISYDPTTNTCVKTKVEDILTKGVSANAKADVTMGESFVDNSYSVKQ